MICCFLLTDITHPRLARNLSLAEFSNSEIGEISTKALGNRNSLEVPQDALKTRPTNYQK